MAHRETLNSILTSPGSVQEISPGLYTTLPGDAAAAAYDRRAAVYDAIVGRSLYHQIFWGTSAASYSRFAGAATDAAGDGCFAEAGCGSLLFSSHLYRGTRRSSTLLIDRSIQMLRLASTRISLGAGARADGVALLHADLAAMPFRPGVFSSILSLNVLHVPCDVRAITAELSRVLMPDSGRLFVSSLVRSGRWSDWYMAALHRIGELAAPLTVDELCATVAGEWGVVESTNIEGNMCFLVVRHAG